MVRSCLGLLLAALLTGCATAPRAAALCSTLGCIEPNVGTLARVGAELELSQCADRYSAMNTYKYVKVAAGWSLVFYETVQSAQCGTRDGA